MNIYAMESGATRVFPRLWLIVLFTFVPAICQGASDEEKAIDKLLHSRQVDVRANAAIILKHKDSLHSAQALATAMIKDESDRVRSVAAGGLWGHDHAGAVSDSLWQATRDVPEVAVRAAGALRSTGVPAQKLEEAFRKGLQGTSKATRFNGARGLIGMEDPVTLLPYLLDYLQYQAGKGNSSSASSAGAAIGRLARKAGPAIYPELLKGIESDQAGNHVVLYQFEDVPAPMNELVPYIVRAANSRFLLNRVAAARLAVRFDDEASLGNTIKQLFADESIAVVSAVAYSCSLSTEPAEYCIQPLRDLMESGNEELREAASDALSDLSEYLDAGVIQGGGLAAQLRNSALDDASDDVRRKSIEAYLDAEVSDASKAQLLVEVALKESQAYIITFALSRLNRFQQYIDAEQKKELSGLKTHTDSEVRRIVGLLL
jgi:HEAT repeat protein